jgi:hypothetical protein
LVPSGIGRAPPPPAPRLLGLCGMAYIIGGLLTADPVAGFPAGTTPEMVHATWHGAVQNASRGASSLLLIAASLVIATWFAAEGRRGWAWFYAAAIPTVFVPLTAIGLAIGGNPTALAFLMTPWIWVTARNNMEISRRNSPRFALMTSRGARDAGRGWSSPCLCS